MGQFVFSLSQLLVMNVFYSGYNKFFIEPVDAQKTTFRTPFGNYFYKVIPFRLKNLGVTYQRTMTLIFGDMLHKQVKN